MNELVLLHSCGLAIVGDGFNSSGQANESRLFAR